MESKKKPYSLKPSADFQKDAGENNLSIPLQHIHILIHTSDDAKGFFLKIRTQYFWLYYLAGLISLFRIFKVNNYVTFSLKYVPSFQSLYVNYEKKSKSHLNFIQKCVSIKYQAIQKPPSFSTFLEYRILENYLLKVFFSLPPTRISLDCNKFCLIDHHNKNTLLQPSFTNIRLQISSEAIMQRAIVNETACLYFPNL